MRNRMELELTKQSFAALDGALTADLRIMWRRFPWRLRLSYRRRLPFYPAYAMA